MSATTVKNDSAYHVKIISDGSHCKFTAIGGYAAEIHLHQSGKKGQIPKDDTIISVSGVYLDAPTSTHVEIKAIVHSLKKVSLWAQQNNEKIASISVYTDSLSAIAYNAHLRFNGPGGMIKINPVYHRLLHRMQQQMLSIENAHNVQVYLKKVKGHVPDELANNIEKIHNRIDEKAFQKRIKVEKFYLKKNHNNSIKVCGIILPKNMKHSDYIEYEAIGYKLAADGYQIRVTSEDPLMSQANCPIKKGVRRFLQTMSSSLKLNDRFVFFKNELTKREGGNYPGIHSGNRLFRIREYVNALSPSEIENFKKMNENESLNFYKDILGFCPTPVWNNVKFDDRRSLNSELASLINYGKPCDPMGSSHDISGHFEFPSLFIVSEDNQIPDGVRPLSVGKWSKYIGNLNKTPNVDKEYCLDALNIEKTPINLIASINRYIDLFSQYNQGNVDLYDALVKCEMLDDFNKNIENIADKGDSLPLISENELKSIKTNICDGLSIRDSISRVLIENEFFRRNNIGLTPENNKQSEQVCRAVAAVVGHSFQPSQQPRRG